MQSLTQHLHAFVRETAPTIEEDGGTESTVLGPFHMTESPRRELGDSIDLIGGSRVCVISGQVRGTDGRPLPGAELHYPIPTDGPVGRLLTATGRHPYWPALDDCLQSSLPPPPPGLEPQNSGSSTACTGDR